MRLTDAVVKGKEMLEPRQGGDLYAPEEGCEKYGGCYRGMAVVGAGAVELPIVGGEMEQEEDDDGYDLTHRLISTWPWVSKVMLPYPCTCSMKSPNGVPVELTVAHIMAHLWDRHVSLPVDSGAEDHTEALDDPWTFERITDWLRSIEPKD